MAGIVVQEYREVFENVVELMKTAQVRELSIFEVKQLELDVARCRQMEQTGCAA